MNRNRLSKRTDWEEKKTWKIGQSWKYSDLKLTANSTFTKKTISEKQW